MKKVLTLLTMFLLISIGLFASEIDGKWEATIDTDNGPFSFTAEYVVKGEKITGTLTSDMGSVEVENGKINGSKFEYTINIDGYTIKHEGELVKGKLNIKSSGDYGDSEFTMTKVKKE